MSLPRPLAGLLIALLWLALPAQAVTLDHSRAELTAEPAAIAPGQAFWVALTITPQQGWHSYWKNPGDSGIATSIDWTLPAGFTAGPIAWPAPERLPYAGTLVNFGYRGPAALLVKITPPPGLAPGQTATLAATAEWLVCADICVPQQADFTLALPVAASAPADPAAMSLFAAARAALPQPAPWKTGFARNGGKLALFAPLSVAGAGRAAAAEFFPDAPGRIPPAAAQELAQGEAGLYLDMSATGQDNAPLPGVLVITNRGGQREAFSITATQQNIPPRAAPLGWGLALAFAFLGGLILNLMPCVFPVLALKALHVLHGADRSAAHRRHDAVAYAAGVVASFLALAGVMLALRAAGDQIGWGFQLQSPWFVAALALLFAAMALNLLDVWHFGFSGAGIGQRLTEMHGPAGSFFTGVLAAVVASPCTAPLMAPALGVALALPAALALAVFAALGLGLAAPFLLVGFAPALARLLPRPGVWMAGFRKIMALPLFATSLWLGWVFWQQVAPTHIRLAETADGPRYQPFNAAKLAGLRQAGKPVFVNMTADWCITCLFNEKNALSRPAVAQAFEKAGVTAMKGDWTRRDAAITAYLAQFGRPGVPLYVFYPARGEPVVLPQILTEDGIAGAIR